MEKSGQNCVQPRQESRAPDEKVPAPHARHADVPVVTLLYWPTAHAVHTEGVVAAAWSAYVPAEHAVQVVVLVGPFQYLPGAQLTQDVPPKQYWPGEQGGHAALAPRRSSPAARAASKLQRRHIGGAAVRRR